MKATGDYSAGCEANCATAVPALLKVPLCKNRPEVGTGQCREIIRSA